MQVEQIVHLLEVYKYLILFPLVVLEGVIVTIVAGFLASIGLMNIYLVIIVAIFADLTSDAFYYSIGRFGREKALDKWGHLLGITTERILAFEKRLHKHAGKVLFIGKFLPGIDLLSVIAAGVVRVPFRTFSMSVILPSVPKFAIYAIVGYFFGGAYTKIAEVLGSFTHAFILILGVVIVIGICLRFLVGKAARSLFGLK